ncbi:MAG: M48 family metalloprotease [Geminicoccaceae bacterium]|nr:M48 family metalloprotease [Geminicoccaceae bacterium]MDW8371632.1 M48 family metalloprotease [Geminicoccaceae bacterium]
MISRARRWARAVVLGLVILLAPWLAAPLGALAIVRDAEIEAHVRSLADPIFEAAGLAPGAVDVYLVKDERLNAFVAGGQNLFLNTGLIARTTTPEQLAGVIAHEAGHIAGGHLSRQMLAREQATKQMLLGTALGLAAAALGGPAVGTAIIAGGATAAQSGVLAFTRGQEQAADLTAIDYLAALGLPPRGLIEFLAVVETQDLRITREGDVYRRTHPLTRDRIAALEAADASSPYRGRTLGAERAAVHERVRAKLDGFLGDPETVLRRWNGETFAARYARAAAHHRRGEVEDAVRLARGLVAERPKDPYLHELLGQILFENGRIEESIGPWREAVRLAPEAPLLRLGLARALLERRDGRGLEEAAVLAREVVRHEPRDIGALRVLGTAEGRLGRIGPASLAFAEAAVLARNKRDAELHLGRARQHVGPQDPAWLRLQDLERAVAELPEPRPGDPGRR